MIVITGMMLGAIVGGGHARKRRSGKPADIAAIRRRSTPGLRARWALILTIMIDRMAT